MNEFVRRFDGMDGSHYQPDAGPVDWAALKSASAGSWIAWKATQSTAYRDPTFKSFRAAAIAQGFRYRLFYHWLSSTTNPAAQATNFLAAVGALAVGEGAMLDAEEGGITVEMCLAVLEAVEAVTKRPMSVYTGLYVSGGTIFRDSRIRTSEYGPRPIHLAAYVTVDSLNQRMKALGVSNLPVHAWQYSSNGPVPGITGRCDMNQVLDYAVMNTATGQPDVPSPTPGPTPPSAESNLDDMRVITNETVYNYEGTDYGPQIVKWVIMPDLSKQHLTPTQYKSIGGKSDTDVQMTTAEIDSTPNYVPPTGGGSGPTAGTLKFVGTGEIALT